MKILRYKSNGNDVEIVNKNLEQINGNIYLCVVGGEEFNYYLKCSEDVCYPVTTVYNCTLPAQSFDRLKDKDEKAVFQALENKILQNGYIKNIDILFCELLRNSELATRCKAQQAKARAERAEQEAKARQQEEEREEQARKQRQAEELQEAYNRLKTKNAIDATQFEMLCNDAEICLPAKFVGWLRNFCGTISIKQREKDDKEQYLYQYQTEYYYTKGHDSTSIRKYADMLAAKVLG